LSHAREMGLIEAHSELEAQNRELERVNEEKSKFLSTVSHELKTPLTSMLAFTDILKRDKDDHLSEQEMEHLTVIQRNGRRLSILIDDLVDVSKFDAGTLQISKNEFDVRELLDDIVQSFEPIMEGKAQDLRLTAPDGPILIYGDQARLAQVFTNLISNASKYSPEETAIIVEANIAGDRLGIAVSDSGQGISEEDQDKLFTPFFRVERDVESAIPGTGLGLAISRSIVELHSGEINVVSELGSGSRFWVSIPGVVTDEADDEFPADISELPPSDDSRYDAHEAA
jgi:signal transduction histidine kinase